MVTIPAKLRKKHNLTEGREIVFREHMGVISIIPVLDFEELRKLMPTASDLLKSYEESREEEIKLEHADD